MRICKDRARKGPLADGQMSLAGHYGNGRDLPNYQVALTVCNVFGTPYRVGFTEHEANRIAHMSIGIGLPALSIPSDYMRAYRAVHDMSIRELRDAEIARRLGMSVGEMNALLKPVIEKSASHG